jgi:hypothetical protein
MKLNQAGLLEKLSVVLVFFKRFRFITIFILFSLMYGYVLVQVTTINEQTPSEKKISDKVTALPRPKIDQQLIDKITSLEEENVQVKTIFNDARKNPFAE